MNSKRKFNFHRINHAFETLYIQKEMRNTNGKKFRKNDKKRLIFRETECIVYIEI